MLKNAVLAAFLIMSAGAAQVSANELPPNDYPTIARADYVFACMQVNGQTREALEKCSCSIDQIAAAACSPERTAPSSVAG